MRILAALLAACLGWAATAAAQAPAPLPPTLNAALLGLDRPGPAAAEARETFQRYLAFNLPRAFALSRPDLRHAAYGSGGSAETVRKQALDACVRAGGRACEIVAEGLTVAGATPPPPPGPLLRGGGWELVPDDRYIWWGPARARGVYVFAHGYGHYSDPRGSQPPMHVRAFNNAGFDVVRFDREPFADAWKDRVADWLRDGLRTLRAQGWQRIVCGGQSRGAWTCLQANDTPGAVDAVIAIAPASHGTDDDSQFAGRAELYRILADAAPDSRVALVQFAGDPFERDPARRAAMARDLLARRLQGLLVIDQPAGFTGHSAGYTTRFALDYGACLLRFATEARPRNAC
jgi:dienelactone hydrolase